MPSDQSPGSSDIQPREEKNAQQTQPVSYKHQPPFAKFPPGKKARFPIILGAIIIAAIVIFAVIFIWVINPGEEISNIIIDLDHSHPDNLGVNVLVDSGSVLSLAGVANLRITYQDRVVFNSEVRIDDSGNGFLSIPYSGFIEGNGEYLVIVDYRDVESPPFIYHVRHIVERLDISVNVGLVDGNGRLLINVNLLEEDGSSMLDNPKGAQLTVSEIKLIDDGTYITTGDPPQNISENYYGNEYPYNKSGNYAINVSLENTRVNPDSNSPYLWINETWEGFLNILPEAEAIITDTYPTPNSSNYTVEFDASSSWNDGDITKYIWDFDGDGTIDLKITEPKVNFSEYSQDQDYNAILNVEGDVIVNPFTGYVEKGSSIIRVYPP